jgi:hypothetical protein
VVLNVEAHVEDDSCPNLNLEAPTSLKATRYVDESEGWHLQWIPVANADRYSLKVIRMYKDGSFSDPILKTCSDTSYKLEDIGQIQIPGETLYITVAAENVKCGSSSVQSCLRT